MSLLQQLKDAIIATDQPLAALLQRTMVLAARLEDPLLDQWVHLELDGYPAGAAVPSYRRSRPVAVRGKFTVYGEPDVPRRVDPAELAAGHAAEILGRKGRSVAKGAGGRWYRRAIMEGTLDDVPIDPSRVDPPDHPALFSHVFLQPVGIYEDWLRTPIGDLHVRWPPEAIARYKDRLREGAICEDAWQVLARSHLLGVVGGVRNGLIELVLTLEREVPEAGDLPASQLPVSRAQVTNIVKTIIYAGVTTVSDNSIHVQNSTAGNIAGGHAGPVQQGDVSITQQQRVDLTALLGDLRTAVDELGGLLSAEQLDDVRERMQDLEDEAAAQQPRRQRMLQKLEKIRNLAGPAGAAGAAVIDAVQAIHRALSA